MTTDKIELHLGGVPVMVEYEHQAGEKATLTSPGCDPSVSILGVSINGVEVDDPESVFSKWQMDAWAEAIQEHMDDTADADREAHREYLAERYEDHRNNDPRYQEAA